MIGEFVASYLNKSSHMALVRNVNSAELYSLQCQVCLLIEHRLKPQLELSLFEPHNNRKV